MATFFLLPTTDIHLVLNPDITNGTEFRLRFLLKNSRDENDFTEADVTFDLTEYTESQNIISVSKNFTDDNNRHFTLTAVNPGKTFFRVKYGEEEECIVRVWVHTDIDLLWVNHNKITIYKGSDFQGYVPSVFAKFSSPEEGEGVADITYHPYLNYFEVGTNYLSISDHIITSTSSDETSPELNTELKISIGNGNVIEDKVAVSIKNGYNANREILEKIHIGSSKTEHFNLLILGDGFKDKSDFELYRNQLIDKLKNDSKFSPWNLVLENFTIWSAFEPTNDLNEGVTINNPVSIINRAMPSFIGEGRITSGLSMGKLIEKVGIPERNSPQTYTLALTEWAGKGINSSNLDQKTFDEWKSYNTVKGYIENKDTVLGTRIGNRLGDQVESKIIINGSPQDLYSWYRPYREQQRDVNFDRRRYPQMQHRPDAARYSLYELEDNGDVKILRASPYDEYIGSLKYVNLSNPQDRSQYDMGKNWQTNGKDSEFIAILSNHDKFGGQQLMKGSNLRRGSLRRTIISRVLISSLSGRSTYNISLDPSNQQKLFDNVDAKSNIQNYDSLVFVGLFSHELMHSFGLADEYEGEGVNEIPTEAIATNDVDKDANVMSIFKVTDNPASPLPNKSIDADKIKWNLLRVSISSMIIEDATVNGSTITVQLEKNQSAKWKKVKNYKDKNNNPVILPLYIRSSIYDKDEETLFYQLRIERIHSVNTVTEKVELLVDNSELNNVDITKLKKGSHIFMPKRLFDDYDISQPELKIINPRVLNHIRLNKSPFAPSTDCSVGNNKPEFPDSDELINISNPLSIFPLFSSPKNRFLVLGIYEGGDGWNCGVYRPSGWSILRAHTLKHKVIIDNYQEITDPDVFLNVSMYDVAHYARFDFFAKYYALVRAYPTGLQDLDINEYQDYDSSNF